MQHPPLVRADNEQASLEDRVRSYLDVNCAVCHNPKRRFAAFDARILRDLGEQGLIHGAWYYNTFMGDDTWIVSPGRVDRSVLHLRMSSSDPVMRMPPLGSHVVDQQGLDLLERWIRSLPPAADQAIRPASYEDQVRDTNH